MRKHAEDYDLVSICSISLQRDRHYFIWQLLSILGQTFVIRRWGFVFFN